MIHKRISIMIKQVACYLFYYVLLSALLVFIIWLMCKYLTLEEAPFEIAVQIFINSFEFDLDREKATLIVFSIGRFLTNIYIFFFVAYLCAKMFQAPQIFFFAKYGVYDVRSKKLIFRYWTSRRRFRYVFGAKIVVSLKNSKAYQKGVNNVKTYWEWSGKPKQLNMIRGVRYIQISKDDTKELIKEILKRKNKERLQIDISITATDSSGQALYEIYTYRLSDIIAGYQFAPITNDPYCAKKLIQEVGPFSDLGTVLVNRIYFSNYHNFDHVYRQEEPVNKYEKTAFCDLPDSKDIVSQDEAVFGKKGLGRWFNEFLDFLTWFWYDHDMSFSSFVYRMGTRQKFLRERKRFYK